MPGIKETAETIINSGKAVGRGMYFIERFWLKKNGPGITIFVVVLCGFITAIIFYNQGVKDEKENSISEIKSLKGASIIDSFQIKRLKRDNNELQSRLDTCNSSSNSANLEELINKKLDEAERIKKLIERKLTSTINTNTTLKTVPR